MRLAFALSLLLALVAAPAARAAWFPAEPVDGPSPDIVALGGFDVARDGGGALAYVKRDGAEAHVYLSRLVGGAWRPPERVDRGLGGTATEAKVATADGGRLAVVWITDTSVFAAVAPAGNAPQPLGPVQQIGGPGASRLDLDMSINGAAYAVWEQGGDVRAARLQDTAWTGVGPSLDIDPADLAGTRAGRPRVAASAEGFALATWGELRPDGRTHVFARRLTGTNLSVAPQDLTLDSFQGSLGGNADSPDLDIEDDGSFAWVAFRQDIGGGSRVIARRLLGSTFEPPVAVDGGAAAAEPRIDLNGRGIGEVVAEGLANNVIGAFLNNDVFQPTFGLDTTGSTAPPQPEVATGERRDVVVAWHVRGADGSTSARGRFKPDAKGFESETVLSRPDLGPVEANSLAAGADRIGDFAVAVLQGTDAGGAMSVASYDRAPGVPFLRKSDSFKRQSRPRLTWGPAVELWGPVTYNVFVDGRLVGSSPTTSLVPRRPIAPGLHTLRIAAVDRRGQQAVSRQRTLRIDNLAPVVKVRISGFRARGRALRIVVSARDRGGSGVAAVSVSYGDGSRSKARSSVHRYRAGAFTLVARVTDKAGNVGRARAKLRIR